MKIVKLNPNLQICKYIANSYWKHSKKEYYILKPYGFIFHDHHRFNLNRDLKTTHYWLKIVKYDEQGTQ